MTMHDIVFSMNSAGGGECTRARCRPITFGPAHPSLRRAATCHVRTLLPGPEAGCPFMTGTTVHSCRR